MSGKIQDESILPDLNYKLNTRATELLFLKWFIDHLSPKGRAGVIVPSGVLFGSTGAARKVREMLLTECDLQAVITMPAGVFKPYAGVATAILVFEKSGPTRSVWFYEMTADGFSLSDTHTPVDENDIPDILERWPGREESGHSFCITRKRLAEFGDVLTPGLYRKPKMDATAHERPAAIVEDLLKMEQEIANRLLALRAKLEQK